MSLQQTVSEGIGLEAPIAPPCPLLTKLSVIRPAAATAPSITVTHAAFEPSTPAAVPVLDAAPVYARSWPSSWGLQRHPAVPRWLPEPVAERVAGSSLRSSSGVAWTLPRRSVLRIRAGMSMESESRILAFDAGGVRLGYRRSLAGFLQALDAKGGILSEVRGDHAHECRLADCSKPLCNGWQSIRKSESAGRSPRIGEMVK